MAEEMKITNLRLHVSFREDTALLSDEEFGRLVRYGLLYIEGDADLLPPGPEALFVPRLVRMINEDNERYISVVEKRREAAMKRWAGEEEESKSMQTDANASDALQNMPNPNPNPNPISKDIALEKEKEKKEKEKDGVFAPKPIRHKYGAYGHVLLEDEQLKILQREFPTDWKERIQRMDDYCEANGKTYRNYLQAIRNWARRDGKDIDPNEPSPSGLVALTLRRKA